MSYPALQPRNRRLVWGLLIAFAMVWSSLWGTVLSPHTAHAAPSAQISIDDSAIPLALGEYGTALTIADDILVYTVDIPEAGAYLITAVDEEAAATFDVIIYDADENVLYDDVFTTIELALEQGTLTLEFTASATEALLFVVMGEVGSMSGDPTQPGRLFTGSAYTEELINEARHATLSVPAGISPQRVIVYVEAEEDDAFFVTVQGGEVGYIDLDTDTGNLLAFWSQGGEYELSIEPFERRSSFALAIFLSPPPTPLAPGDIVDNLIPAGAQDVFFELVLEQPYDLVSIDLLEEAEDLSIELIDSLYDATLTYSSFGEPFVDAENVPPGIYYIRVSGDAQDEDRLITLAVDGDAGQPIESLVLDEAAVGVIEEGTEVVYYQVDIPEAGALVAAAIASDAEDAEFDIAVGLRVGEPIWHSFAGGAEDILTFVAPVAGTYYVGVVSNGTVGDYAVAVSAGDLAPAVGGDKTPYLDSIDAFDRTLHRLEVPEGEHIVTLMLVGSPAGDLDLRLSGYNEQGQSTLLEYGLNFGAVEVVSGVTREGGILEVQVTSYSDLPSNYALIAYIDDPRRLLSFWAVDAAASSELDVDDYSALQATGAPDTLEGGDSPTAWAPLEDDAGEETLELAFEFPLVPAEINIYESNNPGAIFGVQIYDLENDEWMTVWEGEPAAVEEPTRIFSIDLPPSNLTTDGVRILLDTAAVPGSNAIDAVELRGRP